MNKKACILACLLISSTFGGGLAKMSIANPGIDRSNTQSADIPAPGGDLSNLVLTLQDLPPGFTEMSSGAANFKNQLSKPASVFAYQKIDDKQFQLLIGCTTQLSDPMQQANFDEAIREGTAAKAFSEGLNSNKESQFTNPTALTLQDNIGEVSAGSTTQGKIRGIPMNVDFAIFRRVKIGAFMVIIDLDGMKPTITIGEAAGKLDTRMMELKPDLTKPQ